MKRSFALLLVFALLIAMFPAASAAAPAPAAQITAADVLPLTSVPNRYEPMSGETLEEGCWIAPRFETYGQAAVIGTKMKLRTYINDESLPGFGTCGVMIFKGTYDQLTESSEPVAVYTDDLIGGHPGYSQHFSWDTTGCTEGDYTAIFYLTGLYEEVEAASAADLYLSKKEIPLEAIDIYIYELNDTPDVMYCANDGAFSFGVEFEPYHTTAYRGNLEEESPEIGEMGSNKPDNAGRFLVRSVEDGEATLTVKYDDGIVKKQDEVKIVVKDPSEIIQFSEYSVGSCDGQLVSVDVIAPEGVENVQIVNMNPYTVEIVKVEGNTIYLRGLIEADGEIAIYNGSTWDWLTVHSGPHGYHDVSHPATCTEDGYYINSCTFCGDVLEYEVYPARGHEFDSEGMQTVSEPTATKDGLKTGKCYVCGDVEEILPRIFTDTEPDWFYSDPLDYCYANGIINGITATTFGPTLELNRAQLVTMLYRHAGSPAVEGESTFTDVPADQFYTDPVAWASTNGIVNGYEDGTFRPGNAITREQIVTMLHRYIVMLGKDNGERNDLAAFEDLDLLHEYAKEPMQWAVANGVINGLSETVLGAQESANRAQTVTILYRIITGVLETGETVE